MTRQRPMTRQRALATKAVFAARRVFAARQALAACMLAALVAACGMTAERQAQRDDERCAARGLQPQSKAHDDCVTALQSQRDGRMQQRHRELVERPAPRYSR